MKQPIRIVPTRLDLFRELPAGTTGVEVGVLRGDFSAEILTTGVEKLYLVDCWESQTGAYELDVANAEDHEANERRVRDRFKDDPRVEILKGFSLDVYAAFKSAAPNYPDFAFAYIDAAHDCDSAYRDLRAWAELLYDDGVLFVHDFTVRPEAIRQGFGVVKAVYDFCEYNSWEITAITEDEWPTVKLERV